MTTKTFKFSDYPKNIVFFCGLDVHKRQLEVALYARDDTGKEFLKSELFKPDQRGLDSVWNFVKPYRPVKFTMEATNVYHHVVATFLDDKKKEANWEYECFIVPPADAAGIPGRPKTDRIDARKLAVYTAAGVLSGGKSVIVPIEDIRALFRTAFRIECDMTAMKNRIKKSMDRGGLRPEKFNLNHHWAREFLYELTSHEGIVGDFYASSLGVDSRLPAIKKLLLRNRSKFEPFFNVVLSPGMKALIRQDLVELDLKTARKTAIAVEIDGIMMTRPGLRQLVENVASIPGFTPYSAAWFAVEVGPVHVYRNVRCFVSYCGCCPRVMETGGKTFSAHVTRRSNKYVRTLLFNSAKVVCVALKAESGLKTYAQRMMAKKAPINAKLAWVTVAQKLARVAFGIMKSGKPFDSGLACNAKARPDSDGSMLSITDRKMLRKARNALNRISKEGKPGIIAKHAKRFADALDAALGKK
jgi:transposase